MDPVFCFLVNAKNHFNSNYPGIFTSQGKDESLDPFEFVKVQDETPLS